MTLINVMFAGPSGIGKTTTAKWLEENDIFNFCKGDFVSGSVSDLLPETKEMSHSDMLHRSSKELQMEDYQIVNLRNKKYSSYIKQERDFITDRSYLDSAAYFMYKQMDKIPQCEIDQFLELTKMLLCKQCTHLIMLEFTQEMIKEWTMEDNNKRILNKYFQFEISNIMKSILSIWGCKLNHQNLIRKNWIMSDTLQKGYDLGTIDSIYGTTKVIVIQEANLELRQRIIKAFINDKL